MPDKALEEAMLRDDEEGRDLRQISPLAGAPSREDRMIAMVKAGTLRRDELEHAIRAATRIIEQDQVIIIGSQSILGFYSEDQLPPEATMSPEVDITPMGDDDAGLLADRLSLDAGEMSDFHATHGFYIEGVGKRRTILPQDWEYRLIGVRNDNTDNATGRCLDPHDLCAAKLMAHREKNFEFVRALIDPDQLAGRLKLIDLAPVKSDQDRNHPEFRRQASVSWAA